LPILGENEGGGQALTTPRRNQPPPPIATNRASSTESAHKPNPIMARRHLATMGLSSAPVTAVVVVATLSAGWLAGHGASAQSLCTSPDNAFRVKVDLFASELGTRIALERQGLVMRWVSHATLLLASCALLCDA
jgi:hypothetical protein